MPQESKAGLNHASARTPEQKALMARIEADGVCPFCAEHFKKYHPKPILRETDYWFVTTNMSPYEGTKHHFLLVYKPFHATLPEQVVREAQADLFASIEWIMKTYHIMGGSFLMRFGDMKYTGSSVEHLHAHVIVGDVDEPDHQPVKVRIG
jgi:diadenosine tetraphosphate (Ap4A) HIT family hydrolase